MHRGIDTPRALSRALLLPMTPKMMTNTPRTTGAFRRAPLALAIAFATLSAAPALAQAGPSDDDAKTLDSVVVTAAGFEQ